MDILKGYIKDLLKKHKNIRIIARKIVWDIRKSQYKLKYATLPIDEKTILFETFMGRQYGCNPKAIYEKLLLDERFEDYKFVWAFKDITKALEHEKLERATIVEHRSREYFKYAATTKVLITNSELDYRIVPKGKQVFVQTWHGTPLKRLRCDIQLDGGNANNSLKEIKMRNDKDVIRYNYFLSPSRFASNRFISAFNLEKLDKKNIMFEAGYPRNDALSNYNEKDIRIIKSQLGVPQNKKVILYAPTFRDNNHSATKGGYLYDLNLDFNRLKKELESEYVIIFRTHYFIANQFSFDDFKDFVIDASQLDDITDLYLISDILITDYSSVFFDYAILKRRMIFYMYDLEEYQNSIRGFYISLDELPGPIVKTENDLIKAIKEPSNKYEVKHQLFNEKYNYLDDGKAAERVIERVLLK